MKCGDGPRNLVPLPNSPLCELVWEISSVACAQVTLVVFESGFFLPCREACFSLLLARGEKEPRRKGRRRHCTTGKRQAGDKARTVLTWACVPPPHRLPRLA